VRRRAPAQTLLLVEDDYALRKVLRTALQRQGYRVIDAANGHEALLLSNVVEGPIDLVLTDVVMPHMSGREFAERLSRTRQGVKVLYMSGYTDGVLDHHGVRERQIDFVPKPVTPDALVDKVREVLSAVPVSGR
jgi:DNA-binding NtrC family response regulator